MKLAFYIGTSFDLEDYKVKIINNMDNSFVITVAKRFPKSLDLLHAKEEYIHAAPIFSREPTAEEILESEKYLGIPYSLLLKYWYNWNEKNEKNKKIMQAHYSAITRYVLYWREFFKRTRPSVFVTTYESTFPEIISVEVAKKLDIKVVYIYGGRMSGSLMLCDDRCAPIYWRNVSEKEKTEISAMLRERYLARKSAENAQIAKDVGRYSDFSPRNISYKLGRLVSYWNNYYSMTKIDRMRTISPFRLVYKYLVGQARQFYSGFSWKKADFRNMNYFLFPLQFVDEANASYQEAFLDQFDLIRDISKVLPANHFLVVKAHPHYRGRDVPIKRLGELKNLKNICIIDPDTSTQELIQNSKAVFIINSTPGYEALALGKPVVTFGHDLLFANDPALITIHDINDLPEVIMKFANNSIRLNEDAVKTFLARYYKHLIFLDGRFGMNRIDLTASDAKKVAETLQECVSFLSTENEVKNKKNGRS